MARKAASVSRGEETDGAFGALRKCVRTFVAGRHGRRSDPEGRRSLWRADPECREKGGTSRAGEVSEGASERAGDYDA